LIYTAVINGVVAVPILFAIMKIANDKAILENSTTGQISNIVGWSTFLIMAISAANLIITFFV
jgi:Mn2+/Fe2+ NRAMP family transporter